MPARLENIPNNILCTGRVGVYPKIHLQQEQDEKPVCGVDIWLPKKTENFTEVTCRNCKDKINKEFKTFCKKETLNYKT